MAKRKEVLTTGEVARICNVAPRTVTKWFDCGQLKGYKIPGSKDRRIPMPELKRFLKEHNMPSPLLTVGKFRILVIDSDKKASDKLAKALKIKADYDIETANSGFDAGIMAQKFLPHAILVNIKAKGIDAEQITSHIRQNDDLQATMIVALAAGISDKKSSELLKKGFNAVAADPLDASKIAETIDRALAIIY